MITNKTFINYSRDIIVILISLVSFSCSTAPGYPRSDHFDGKKFFNPDTRVGHGFLDTIKWLWEMDVVRWPQWIEDQPREKLLQRIGRGRIRITYINQGTTLIQLDNCNILTDPIWSDKAGPYSWLGVKRVRKPGIPFDDLPPVDLILISHDHYDHLDIQTLKKLYKIKQPKIITGLGIKRILNSEGIFNVTELDWWENCPYKGREILITFVPASHSSGRGIFDTNRTLWGGFVIKGKSGTIYFAGDSGYADFVNTIKKTFPQITVSLLPLGSYEKRWYMKHQHMNPSDAVKIHKILNSQISMGIHFATFLEHPEQSIDAHEKDLKIALKKYSFSESCFIVPKFGEGIFIYTKHGNGIIKYHNIRN